MYSQNQCLYITEQRHYNHILLWMTHNCHSKLVLSLWVMHFYICHSYCNNILNIHIGTMNNISGCIIPCNICHPLYITCLHSTMLPYPFHYLYTFQLYIIIYITNCIFNYIYITVFGKSGILHLFSFRQLTTFIQLSNTVGSFLKQFLETHFALQFKLMQYINIFQISLDVSISYHAYYPLSLRKCI